MLSSPHLPSLTEEQVNCLIAQANSLRDKAIISLLADSGMRLGEVANIKAKDNLKRFLRRMAAIGQLQPLAGGAAPPTCAVLFLPPCAVLETQCPFGWLPKGKAK